jgi:CO dehydrogenase maturation factor
MYQERPIMKLSLSGKGGSGKSTLTSLLAMAFRDRGYYPVVVDADESNSVLYRMLGLESPPVPLVALAGGRQMVRQLMPPGYKPGSSEEGTHILARAKINLDDIPAENLAQKDHISLLVIGKIVESLEGCACPMGVLGREFLGKLQLKEKEIAITDMEAGIEHFGRGFEASLDSVMIVVEPSFESISLAERIVKLAGEIGIQNVWAVLNKVGSEAVAGKLNAELLKRKVTVISSIPYDEAIFNACLEGKPLISPNRNTNQAINAIIDYILEEKLSN